jgi:hypothetical protein
MFQRTFMETFKIQTPQPNTVQYLQTYQFCQQETEKFIGS